jgi:hypothetical protein
LTLGDRADWLSFSIESADGTFVKQKKHADVEGVFTLPSASRAKIMVNLADAFELNRFGRYSVTATVRIPGWNQTFSSPKPGHFGISAGVKLWESAFGVPSVTKEGRPEVRKFQLIQANHLKELSLYVRICDESEADTFSLFPLGPLLGFSRPEPQMDRWSNLHVLFQDGARRYRYNMITPDGLLLARQTWEIANDSRPGMTVNSEGRIEVKGGVRRVSGTDLPPAELLSEKSPLPVDPLDADKPAHAEKVSK